MYIHVPVGFVCRSIELLNVHTLVYLLHSSEFNILIQFFHEEMVLQWIVIHPSSRPLLLKNAWFFFELLVSE